MLCKEQRYLQSRHYFADICELEQTTVTELDWYATPTVHYVCSMQVV